MQVLNILFSEAAIAASAYTISFCGRTLGINVFWGNLSKEVEDYKLVALRDLLFLPVMYSYVGACVTLISVGYKGDFFDSDSYVVGAVLGGTMGATFGTCSLLGMIAADKYALDTNKIRSLQFQSNDSGIKLTSMQITNEMLCDATIVAAKKSESLNYSEANDLEAQKPFISVTKINELGQPYYAQISTGEWLVHTGEPYTQAYNRFLKDQDDKQKFEEEQCNRSMNLANPGFMV